MGNQYVEHFRDILLKAGRERPGALTFANFGAVEATENGHVLLDGQWVNHGVFRLRDNGQIDLGGTFTMDDIRERHGSKKPAKPKAQRSGRLSHA